MSDPLDLSSLMAATDGSFQIKSHSPKSTCGFRDKESAKESLEKSVEIMAEMQELLYAHDRYSLLLIFQAMDAAGKDSTIKHVMSGINPQGCQVTSFKQPSAQELDHDYLWRVQQYLPERGRIGIFNRSYYEEVLVVKVHENILAHQKLPEELKTKDIWKNRYRQIRDFERYLHENGTVILKFFLNVSKNEQKKRFLERIEKPEKNWKFSASDIGERQHWDAYQNAYEESIAETSRPHAPWFVIPADHKWFTRLAVAQIVTNTLSNLKMSYPKVDAQSRAALEDIKQQLLSEKE